MLTVDTSGPNVQTTASADLGVLPLRPGTRRSTALGAALLVALAGLAQAPASTASVGPVGLRLSGVLLSAGEEGHRTHAVALLGGDLVPVRGLTEHPAGRTRFTGTVTLPADVVSTLEARGTRIDAATVLSAGGPVGREALALVDARSRVLTVRSAELAPLAAADGPVTHEVFLAAPDNIGALALTDTQILGSVGQVTDYWQGESGGRISDFDLPSSVRHYTSVEATAANGCGLFADDTFWAVLQEAAALFPGVDYSSGTDQVGVVVPGTTCAGGALGVGSMGGGLTDGGGFVSLDDPQQFNGVTAHEMGHNFGLGHANLQTCGSEVCQTEYGGIFDIMGYGVAAYDQTTALSTPFREHLGIVQPGEVERLSLDFGASPESVTRTIAPRSSPSGRRSLLVTDPDDGSEFYLDYRSGGGTDAGSAYAGNMVLTTVDGERIRFRPGVTRIRAQGNEAIIRSSGQDASMIPGETWTNDSGTLSMSVAAMDASSASVTISWAPGAGFTTVGDLELTRDARPGGYASVAPDAEWDPSPWTTTQWLRDGEPVAGATDGRFSIGVADVGHQLSARVTAWGYGLRPVTRTTDSFAVDPAQFDILATPTVTGSPLVGSSLAAVGASWAPTYENLATAHWQWQAGRVPIAGAADDRFLTVTEALAGKRIRACQVLSAPGYDTLTICSPETAAVSVRGPIPLAPNPTVTGVPAVGSQLRGVAGTWTSGTDLAREWLVAGEVVGSGATFTPRAADVGGQLRFRVTGTHPDHLDVVRSVTVTVAKGTLTRATPKIRGTAEVGRTLAARPGSWTSGTRFAYAWYASGKTIRKATRSKLVLTRTLRGKRISVRVTGSKPGYTSVRRTSAKTARVAR